MRVDAAMNFEFRVGGLALRGTPGGALSVVAAGGSTLSADEALLLAARAHHIKRWESQRSSYPEGRKGYLRWRTDLHKFHAQEAGAILEECGYDAATVARVQQIISKHGLGRDPDVQALEDALCLVFLDTQLAALIADLPEETMVNVLRKTWKKMSEAAREHALAVEMRPSDREFVLRALSDG